MHDARTIRPVGPPPPFNGHPPGAVEHQSMNFESGSPGVIQKRRDYGRINAHITRLSAVQSIRPRAAYLSVWHKLL
jgi:hypothetical protein